MSGATPWWGTLVVATVGFAGVLLSQWWTSKRDRARAAAEREDRSRQQRVMTYAAFADACRALQLATEGAVGREKVTPERAETMNAELARLSITMQFIAPANVRDAVDTVFAALGDIMGMRLNGSTHGPRWDESAVALRNACDVAIAEMLADVGLDHGKDLLSRE